MLTLNVEQDVYDSRSIFRYRRLIFTSAYHRIRRGKLEREQILNRVYTRIDTDITPPFLCVDVLKGQVRCYVDERLPSYTQCELFN